MYKDQDYQAEVFTKTGTTQSYESIGILFTREMHLHVHIISIRRVVWVCKTIFTPPLFIEVPVPSQNN
jgi:hypothetical protein